MGIELGTAAGMEGIHASVAGLGALFLEDDRLDTAAGAGAVVDVLQRRYEIRLDRLAVVKQLEAQLAAVKARDAAEAVEIQHAMTPPEAPVHERTYTEMSAVEEIAGVLTISSPAAGALVTQSRQLCSLPLAMDALSAGTISWQHAKIIAEETDSLGAAGATALAAHFLNPHPARGAAAGELVPSRFRARVRGWRERHHPESLEKRHTKSAEDRRMEYTPDRDGMAWLSLYMPADTANAIWNRTTALARGLQGPDEPRTMTQLRLDIAAGLLLNAPVASGVGTRDDVVEIGKVPAPKVDVLVTVPVFSLMGFTDEPATLDGHGPIPASMARILLADGASSFYRVLVDPRDGAPLEIGRTRYRLTKAMKQALQLRDGKNAPSPAAATPPSTMTPTTLKPGTKAETPGSATWPNSAQNITASNTTAPGHPHRQRNKNHPAGPHPPADTTKPNTTTGNHHNGHQSFCPRVKNLGSCLRNCRLTNQPRTILWIRTTFRPETVCGMTSMRCPIRRRPSPQRPRTCCTSEVG